MRPFLALLLLPLLAFPAGCLGDRAPEPPTDAPPAADPRLEATFEDPRTGPVTRLVHVANVGTIDDAELAASGNWVQGDFVFGSALDNGFFVANISDPGQPRIVARAGDETPFARKAEVVTHPDGRLTLALATGDGTDLWDVTDPARPRFAAHVEQATHYVAQVPGTELIVLNPSSGSSGTNTFIDVAQPRTPRVVGTFGERGCHGTTFLHAAGHTMFRGYCAGIDRTEIWDMSRLDADAPELGLRVVGMVQREDNPLLGRGGLHHLAMANADGTVLVIGDEFSGGGSPGACFASATTPAGTASSPLGALWFYDISDEASPVLRGWVSPPTMAPYYPGPPLPVDPGVVGTPGAGCTAHFGTLVPGEEKLVIAWYNAGVLLVDFTDPSRPRILDQWRGDGADTWSARVHNGYVFTGDLGRGLDVLRLA